MHTLLNNEITKVNGGNPYVIGAVVSLAVNKLYDAVEKELKNSRKIPQDDYPDTHPINHTL